MACAVRCGVLLLGLGLLGCDDAPAQEPAAAPSASAAATCSVGLVEACQRDCDSGDDKACEQLTATYLQSPGAPEEGRRKAAALNQRLCEAGRRYFCPTFAFALAEGHGQPADKKRAREIFTSDCKYDPVACSEYGSLYASGLGVQRDPELGTFLLYLACSYDEPKACRDLRTIEAGSGQPSRGTP